MRPGLGRSLSPPRGGWVVGETHLEPYPSGVVHHRMMATTGLRQARCAMLCWE